MGTFKRTTNFFHSNELLSAYNINALSEHHALCLNLKCDQFCANRVHIVKTKRCPATERHIAELFGHRWLNVNKNIVYIYVYSRWPIATKRNVCACINIYILHATLGKPVLGNSVRGRALRIKSVCCDDYIKPDILGTAAAGGELGRISRFRTFYLGCIYIVVMFAGRWILNIYLTQRFMLT